MSDRFLATEIAADVSAGNRSAVEVCQESLDRIAKRDGELGAFLQVTDEHALDAARRIDADVAAGRPVGPLAGVPVAIKDNLCTEFGRTTCGSRMLEGFAAPYTATAVQRLEAAGAIVVGKTNLDEFAMGSSTENSALGQTRNPWNRECVPGGSSGGSAVAVAAGMTPIALGSDTGGSIRQPASLCGVVGLKPTYGRVSRYGLVAYGSSLDQIGPLASHVIDAALLLGAISGGDALDATSAHEPTPDYVAALTDEAVARRMAGLKIGVPREYFGAGLEAETEAAVRAALAEYEKLGATLVDVSLPHTKYCVAAYYLVATAEASSNLARYDGVHYGHRAEHAEGIVDLYSRSREQGFGPEVKRRIMLGTFALSAGYYDAYYLKALKVRRLIKQDFDAAFEQVDVLACPATPTPAFQRGEKLDDPLQMYLADVYTIALNLAGLPGLVLPCGFSAGKLPIGLQLIGPTFGEQTLFQAGHAFESATDWHARRPST